MFSIFNASLVVYAWFVIKEVREKIWTDLDRFS